MVAAYGTIASFMNTAVHRSTRSGLSPLKQTESDVYPISNHTIVHSRTEYQDHLDPARKRHLLRLWLSIETAA
jgi:hypothetical protein